MPAGVELIDLVEPEQACADMGNTSLQEDVEAAPVEPRKAYMHWVVRDPRAGGWLKSEFEAMSLLDLDGSIFRSHVHVTGERLPVRPPLCLP